MPASQHHRGRHPEDDDLFSEQHLPGLRRATADLSWLLTRGYARAAALKLVGDHFQLPVRQRTAVDRCACSDASLAQRAAHEAPLEALRGQSAVVDGYNLLITVESGLAGGVILRGCDGCLRDMASLHGSYRRVEETLPAVRLIVAVLSSFAPAQVTWHFDAPVSNSGRLKTMIRQEAETHDWPWEIHLTPNPDRLLAASLDFVITADSWILDRAERWVNLTPHVLRQCGQTHGVVDLSTSIS